MTLNAGPDVSFESHCSRRRLPRMIVSRNLPSRSLRAIVVLAAASLLGAAACASASDPAATGVVHCSLFASPSGTDSARGIASAPFRTAQRLANALRPGQTGCLTDGTYAGYLRITHGGRPGARLTMRSVRGAVATVLGRLWIRAGSDYVTIQGLHIVGLPGPTACAGARCPNIPTVGVNSRSASLLDNDITNHHSSTCVAIGSARWGVARQTLVERNIIHDCGRLPATNLEHGIYVGDAVGAVIRSNYIYDNADRGIQLFPHAERTLVEGNVIDSNGEGILIGGDGADPTEGSLVEHNLVTNSRIGGNIESFFPAGAPPAAVNQVTDNCLFGGRVSPALGGVVGAGVGFSTSGNLIADPRYEPNVAPDPNLAADPARRQALAPDGAGPCAALLTRSAPT
jgi:Right handed beta helix region